jgi:hypothetical protein
MVVCYNRDKIAEFQGDPLVNEILKDGNIRKYATQIEHDLSTLENKVIVDCS